MPEEPIRNDLEEFNREAHVEELSRTIDRTTAIERMNSYMQEREGDQDLIDFENIELYDYLLKHYKEVAAEGDSKKIEAVEREINKYEAWHLKEKGQRPSKEDFKRVELPEGPIEPPREEPRV